MSILMLSKISGEIAVGKESNKNWFLIRIKHVFLLKSGKLLFECVKNSLWSTKSFGCNHTLVLLCYQNLSWPLLRNLSAAFACFLDVDVTLQTLSFNPLGPRVCIQHILWWESHVWCNAAILYFWKILLCLQL